MLALSGEVIIGIIVLIGGLLCGIIGFFYNKYKDNELQGEEFKSMNSDDGFFPENTLEQISNSSNAIKQKSKMEKKQVPLKSFKFKKKNFDEVIPCMICKLEIRDKQLVFQCPNCLSYFHIKHLDEWLVNNNDCPVCNVLLTE